MKELNKKIQAQFEKMCATGKLFRVALTGSEIWDLYLKGFGKDPVFRDPESSYHNCNHCNNFIRRYGNIVALTENMDVMTLFDVNTTEEYQASMNLMSAAIKDSEIVNVFFETFDELNSLPYESCKKTNSVFKLGVDVNHKRYTQAEANLYGVVNADEVYTFNHFSLQLPKAYVDVSGKSIESIQADYRSAKEVFQRAMEEIPLGTLQLVKDLIKQGSLLDGDTHVHKVEKMIPFKTSYDEVRSDKKDRWCWVTSSKLPIAKFKNELIGVLCSELAEGEEINKACQAWNKRVDPANYMKAVAPITETQKKEAQKFVEENGYVESFDRRHATLDDIKVTEIKHINSGDGKIKEVSMFDSIKPNKSNHKRNQFENVEEVSIDKFMEDILPSCTSVELFVENRHEGSFVSITTSKDQEAKQIFKWDNSYSWTYKGNLAGKSQIKEAVKSRGGKVDGVVRCSMHFPDTTDDYDLHMVQPDRSHIYYSSHLRSPNWATGMLDLDAQGVDGSQPPEKRVENIVYTDKHKMPKGDYRLYVNNYSRRGFKVGFTIEIEIEDQVTVLQLTKKLSSNDVDVAIINFDGENFTVKPNDVMDVVSSNTISKEVYGLNTNEFHKVNLVCLSPNHWGDNNVGNKHYFFMLDKCKADVNLRSFHSENLIPELAAHRKVLEILGAVNMIEPSDKQLSGLGFNATVKDEVILKLAGNFKRVLKVKF